MRAVRERDVEVSCPREAAERPEPARERPRLAEPAAAAVRRADDVVSDAVQLEQLQRLRVAAGSHLDLVAASFEQADQRAEEGDVRRVRDVDPDPHPASLGIKRAGGLPDEQDDAARTSRTAHVRGDLGALVRARHHRAGMPPGHAVALVPDRDAAGAQERSRSSWAPNDRIASRCRSDACSRRSGRRGHQARSRLRGRATRGSLAAAA